MTIMIIVSLGLPDPYRLAGLIIDSALGNKDSGFTEDYKNTLEKDDPLSWDTWIGIKQKLWRVSLVKRNELARSKPDMNIIPDHHDLRALREVLNDRFPSMAFGKVFHPKKLHG